jgi:RNA polymerase subunit RPABC4/transcription elongation factor Spt4
MAKVYEMQWDCQACGTKKLLGKTHRFCPNCGSPQNPDSRYYPDDSEKVAVEDHVFVGADKTCPACNQLNAGDATFCQACGSPLDAAKIAAAVGAQTARDGEAFAAMGSRDVVKEKFDAEMERVGVKKKNDAGGTNWKLYAIIAAVVVVIGAVIFLVTRTKETTVNVTGHEWNREIRIEQYNNFTEQGWWDTQPAGDNVIRGLCTERQRSTRQVPDGEECTNRRVDQGDGTYREERQCRTKYRDEPVYDQWCTFTGQRWEYERAVITEAKSLAETPYWGEFTLSCDSQRRVGCEREAGRTETYNVVFTGEKSIEYRCPFPQTEWQSIRIESVWTVNVRVMDERAADCTSLKLK